jgi:hypothetical protein
MIVIIGLYDHPLTIEKQTMKTTINIDSRRSGTALHNITAADTVALRLR